MDLGLIATIDLFKIIGILGLLLISSGVVITARKKEDTLFILGGLCLAVYSVYIGDLIFIVLQIVFISSAAYNLIKTIKTEKENLKKLNKKQTLNNSKT